MSSHRSSFADRLRAAVEAKSSPVVVGLDPHIDLLPPPYAKEIASQSRESVANAIERFCSELLDAVAPVVAVVKPQIAFFERLGPPGWAALERIVARAQALDLLVIADAKRGDIGSTAEAYAEYFLGDTRELGGLGADALTVNPYLGSDSLLPFARHLDRGKGLFVVAKTSNPGSSELQDEEITSKRGLTTVFSRVGELARRLGATAIGDCGYSSVGLVVGGTNPEQADLLRRDFPELPFLVPGYGAQGAGPDDVARAFDREGLGALVNASRSILFAWRQPSRADLEPVHWSEASRRECCAMRDAIRAALVRTGRAASRESG